MERTETITIMHGDAQVIGAVLLILGLIMLISSFFPLEWQFYWPTLILGLILLILGIFLFRRTKHKRKCASPEDLEEFCAYAKKFREEVCLPSKKRKNEFRHT